MCQVYEEWLEKNKEWIKALNDLKKNELGFSFTMLLPEDIRFQIIGLTYKEPIPKPKPEVKSGDSAPYLKISQQIEVEETEKNYKEYLKIYEESLKPNITEYLIIGQIFHDEITDPFIGMDKKRKLLIFSEENDHLFHNAAVIWLECNKSKLISLISKSNVGSQPISNQKTESPNTFVPNNPLIYEEVLKHLWLGEIIRSHQGWDIDSGIYSNRFKAMVNFTTGHECHKNLGPLTEKERGDFLIKRIKSHVTLGKVILRRKTQFHDEGMIQTHPGFWGLYAISPLHIQDRGFYDYDLDTTKLVNCLKEAPFNLASDLDSKKFRHNPNGFQIYERVPRLFEDTMTAPGIYLHRSKAHGRDDFLVMVKGNGKQRKVMVACTKGVGADPDLIPKTTAGDYAHANQFKTDFDNTGRELFPFAFPADKEVAIKAGSWANMGFCVGMGDGDVEISTVDFENFAEMYDAVKENPPLNGLLNGFVEPFVCIEISCIDYNMERFEPNVLNGVKQGLIGFPVEVVTLAPCETSLRLYKRNSAQDYDYDCPELEIAEWSRCYRELTYEGENDILQFIDNDFDNLRNKLETMSLETMSLEVNLPCFASLGSLSNEHLAGTKKRMQLAFRIMHAMIASYVAFINHDWASDDYTGSFSGRNFGSGPRDSNMWGPFARPSAASDGTKAAGDGPLCGFIDIKNLGFEFGVQTSEIYKSLGLARVIVGDMNPNLTYLVFDWETTDEKVIQNVIEQKEFLMWHGCTCLVYSQKLVQFFANVLNELTIFCNKKEIKPSGKIEIDRFNTPEKREIFNIDICKEYRKIMIKHATTWIDRNKPDNRLPNSLQNIILKLNQDKL